MLILQLYEDVELTKRKKLDKKDKRFSKLKSYSDSDSEKDIEKTEERKVKRKINLKFDKEKKK